MAVRFCSPAHFYIDKNERGSPKRAARSTNMFYIYILKSLKDNRTYVGYTDNLERRMAEHNAGRSKATKNRRPLELIFSEQFQASSEAKKRELYWKSGAGRRRLKELLKNKL